MAQKLFPNIEIENKTCIVYIGNTKQYLHKRGSNHKNSIKNNETAPTLAQIDFQNVQVPASEDYSQNRTMLEM